MSTKFGRLLASLIAVLLLVTACGKPAQTPQPVKTVAPAVTPTTFESPLDAPTPTQAAFESPLAAPTRGPSSADRAALTGVLVLYAPERIAPEEDGLYLVEVDTESAAQMVFPSVDPETAIQAEVDEGTGLFFFDDVEAGLYAFVVLTPSGQQMSVRELETNAAAIVSVEAQDIDTVVDIGKFRLP